MKPRLTIRSNEAWMAALREKSGESEALIAELRGYLQRILASTLAQKGLGEHDLADLVQEALAQLLERLPSFRGDSAFPTWAAAVATRLGFTELRRRAARADQHREFEAARADALLAGQAAPEPSSDQLTTREGLLAALRRAIDSELTDRQRIATLALLRGVPTVEIAERLDSNQNAVYKLVHDARLRLKGALQRQGVDARTLEVLGAGGDQ